MSDITKIIFINVTEERIAYFNSLLSPDTAEATTMPETYAIGALLPTEEDGNVYRPAGIVVFDLFREVGERSPSAVRIKWLYVEPDERRNGIGSRLTGQAAAAVAGTGIPKLRCDMPPELAKEGLSDFFDARGFRKTETYGNCFEGTVGSLLSMASPVKEKNDNIIKLSDLPDGTIKTEIERIFRGSGIPNAEWLLSKGADWFDMDVSHAVLSNSRIVMLFLVHKRPSGSLKALVLRALDDRMADQDSCMMTALIAARSVYGINAKMEISCEREADQSYLSGFFKDWNVRQLTRMTIDIGKL